MGAQNTDQYFQRLNSLQTEEQSGGTTINEETADPHCHVIGFAGAKGGVGTTTVALNVAMTLVEAGQRVIYIELTPHLGTAAWLLNMPHISAFGDSSAHLDDMNGDFVAQLLRSHSTGLKVLSVSPWVQEAGHQVSTELFNVLFRELKGLADYLVLDFPSDPSIHSVFFLSQCHVFNLVLDADPICIALAKSQLEFVRSQCAVPIFLTVVNRSGIPTADGRQDIQEQVGDEVLVMIPSVPELCYTAALKKLPIVCFKPNSVPALQFSQLSDRIRSHFTEDGSMPSRTRRNRDRRKNDRRNTGGW